MFNNFKKTSIMKQNLFTISILSLLFIFASCEKNDNDVDNSAPKNPDDLYAKTEYNLDMKDFAMAVNKAVNTNKAFRKLIRKEVDKRFDGDFNVLLKQLVDKKVDNYEANGNGAIMRVSGNITVRDLLNSSFQSTQEKQKEGTVTSATPKPHRAPEVQLIDYLTEQYPNLQVAVPFLEEQLEDENYIPPVVFLPEEYDEQTTEYLPAIRDDEEYAQSAEIIPDYACIVISQNERIAHIEEENVKPSTPTNLQLSEKAEGVELIWDMPASARSSNTLGYKIYRAVGSGLFDSKPYTTVLGYMNTKFVDQNITNNVTYYYQVAAFNNFQESDLSGIKSIMPVRPVKAKSFDVEQESLNVVKLHWEFATNEYSGLVNIYKRPFGSTLNTFVASKPVSDDNYTDENVTPGQKIEYKIERIAATGASIPSYDFIYTPYRNMNDYSKVFIRRIKYSDVSKIESCWKGEPEFSIKVLGVTGTTTTELATLFIRLDDRKDDNWTTVDNARGTVTNYWKPGKTNWFDAYSFYIVEDDGGGDGNAFNSLENITLAAQKVGKNFITKDTPTWAKASLDALDVTGKLFDEWIVQNDDKVGYAYLNYYDNPFTTYSTSSTEKSGFLTIQFSDNPDKNVLEYK